MRILAVSIALLLALAPSVRAENTWRDTLPDLASVVHGVKEVLPPTWRVVESDTGRVPIGWKGEDVGVYLMVEDTRTRFFHPSGFHYYSFYRVWLLPPDWEGEMRAMDYVSDSAPAYLLGAGEDFVALYHTAGGNVWEQGPYALCRALGLDTICFTSLNRRVVDLEIETQLSRRLGRGGSDDDGLMPSRIIGLAGDGPSLYMEYVFTGAGDESRTGWLEDLTDAIAGDIFMHLPEVESVYLRRCTSDSYTDTIVTRN